MGTTQRASDRPADHWTSFQFAGVSFTDVDVNPRKREIRMSARDITSVLQQRFNRRELERIARACEKSIIAKDSPVAFAQGMAPQPFASFLLGQVNLVLAGGPREA